MGWGLRMHVLIIGAGRRGLGLARHLIEEDKSITFLDSSVERCQAAQSKLDCMAVCGSATNIEKLKEAGVETTDAVIAVTDSDEVNIVSCGLVAANFPNIAKTIAAIRSITYTGPEGLPSGKILGISHIVNPDQEGALRIVDIIHSGLYKDDIIFPDTNFILYTLEVDGSSPFLNKSLMDVRMGSAKNFVVLGVNRKGKAFVPNGNTKIRLSDTVAVISDDDDVKANINGLPTYSEYKEPDDIIIVGATRITRYLLLTFSPAERKKVKLIEKNHDTATEFAVLFPEILVLNAQITDEQIWDEEEIGGSDLLISLTDSDELNIIAASYAKRIGVKRTIALIRTNSNYSQFALSLGVDVALSSTDVTVDSLLKCFRGESVSAIHTMFNGHLEVYEYIVRDNFRFLGKALKEINLKGKIIVAGVKKTDGGSLVPDGNYVFEAGDTLILSVAHDDSDYLQEIFS